MQEESRTASASQPVIYAMAVFAGAILVFQIQPIAGKFLLPAFGGGASVWTACLFFFQSMLLAGYSYAYLLTAILKPGKQAVVHGALLLVSAVFMPLSFAIAGSDASTTNPGGSIWLVLLLSLGFPFTVLASTAPLIQRWSSITRPARSPYRLYALSNAGALLALVTYPLLIEPGMSLRSQTVTWSIGYGIFVLFSLAACWLLWQCHRRTPDQAPVVTAKADREPGRSASNASDAALTVLMSAGGVVMLLAITGQITQNVAPVPFLWILPLIVYLLTYIVCFSGERFYDRAIWGSLFIVAGSTLIILDFFGSSFGIVPVVSTWLLVLLCICMVCHGELYRLRPDPEGLAIYYLLIAFGGALGGALVAIVAPNVFTRYWEALAGVYVIYLAFGAAVFRDFRRLRETTRVRDSTALPALLERWTRRSFVVGWTIGVLLFPAVVVALYNLIPRYDVASSRNFYGVLNVRDVVGDDLPRRILVDGTTIHGFQLLDQEQGDVPTSYYSVNTGIGLVMRELARDVSSLRVGIVGLGVGTLAAYGETSDEFRFYELNPSVIELAHRHFSFVQDSSATIDIALGDARISMERELQEFGSRQYDVLVIDAFSSDAIPVHLLTLEAHRLYWSHLKAGGV
ncbi:MAG TPA: fused MFS/spermidine synthase, partial [Woeseiaceae bacterium]